MDDKISDGAGISDAYGDKVSDAFGNSPKNPDCYLKVAYENDESSNGFKMMGSKTVSNTGYFINYNAILKAGDSSGEKLYYADGKFICDGGFATGTDEGTSATVGFNTTIKNLSKSGMIEYLSPTSRFNSYVIKDATGSYIGVAFIQISNK